MKQEEGAKWRCVVDIHVEGPVRGARHQCVGDQ